MSARILTVPELKAVYRRFILALGGSDAEATTFADRFIIADLRGMAWQGLNSLDNHVVYPAQQGIVRFGQSLEVVHEAASSLAIEAHGELGQVACQFAMDAALAKAMATGAATFTIRHAGDTGLLASYTSMALDNDCVAMMFNNTNPHVAPWGGNERTHGMDPLSIAIPAGEEYPILLDMALTRAQRGIGADFWRRPFAARPLMFFETLREYLLSSTLEVMACALTAMPFGREKTKRGEAAVWGTVLHIPHFIDPAEFRANVDSYIRQIKNTRRADGIDEIQVPGERGFREHEKRIANGIPIEADVWNATMELGRSLGFNCESTIDTGSDPAGA